jgi:hypothetical protein
LVLDTVSLSKRKHESFQRKLKILNLINKPHIYTMQSTDDMQEDLVGGVH